MVAVRMEMIIEYSFAILLQCLINSQQDFVKRYHTQSVPQEIMKYKNEEKFLTGSVSCITKAHLLCLF